MERVVGNYSVNHIHDVGSRSGRDDASTSTVPIEAAGTGSEQGDGSRANDGY